MPVRRSIIKELSLSLTQNWQYLDDPSPLELYEPGSTDAKWRPYHPGETETEPGETVIIRVPRPDSEMADPALIILPRSYTGTFQVHLSGEKVHQSSGKIPSWMVRYQTREIHLVSIPSGCVSKWVYFVFRGTDSTGGGFHSPIYYSSQKRTFSILLDHILEYNRFGFIFLALALISFFSGMFIDILKGGYLRFSIFNLSVGLYLMTLFSIHGHISPTGNVIQWFLNMTSFFIFPMGMYSFIRESPFRAPRRIFISLEGIHVLFLGASLVAHIVAGVHYSILISLFLTLLFVTSVISLSSGVLLFTRQDRDGKITIIAILLFALAGLRDIFTTFEIYPAERFYFHWGLFGFISLLALVLLLKLRDTFFTLNLYSAELEEKTEKLEDHTRNLEEKVQERTENLNENIRLLETEINLRNEVEKALDFERQQFLSLLDSITSIIYVIDPRDYRIIFANRVIKELYGEDVENTICHESIYGFSKPCDFCPLPRLQETGSRPHIWEQYAEKPGRHFFIVDRMIHWPDGREVKFTFALDITDRKKAEEQLRESEARNRAILDTVPDLFFRIDQDGRFTAVHTSRKEMLLAPQEELIGKAISEVLPPDLAELTQRRIQDLKETEKMQTYEYSLTIADKKHYFESRLVKSGDREYLAIIRDVTDRKEVERIRDSLASVVMNSRDIIVVKDLDLRVVATNQAFAEISGHASVDELIGKTDAEIFGIPPEDEPIRSYMEDDRRARELSPGEGIIREEPVNTHKGETRYFLTRKFPIFNREGTLMGTGNISVDITERKRDEEELQELNATKDRFFSIMAHDLKNPFNAILGISDLLAQSADSLGQEQVHEFILDINQSSHSMYKLLENLLEWSRLQRGMITPDIRETWLLSLVRETVNLYHKKAREKEIDLTYDVPDDLRCLADINMLTSILSNLISNAIKFTHRKGKITVTGEKADRHVYLKVQDTGVGIPEDALDRLFRIDSHNTSRGTENEEGTGLGMILAKDFINLMNGFIDVQSTPGEGSVFTVILPAWEDQSS